jgi:hypothetical protein
MIDCRKIAIDIATQNAGVPIAITLVGFYCLMRALADSIGKRAPETHPLSTEGPAARLPGRPIVGQTMPNGNGTKSSRRLENRLARRLGSGAARHSSGLGINPAYAARGISRSQSRCRSVWLARRMLELIEARISIRLHQAGTARQMLVGILAASVGASRRIRLLEAAGPANGRSSRT